MDNLLTNLTKNSFFNRENLPAQFHYIYFIVWNVHLQLDRCEVVTLGNKIKELSQRFFPDRPLNILQECIVATDGDHMFSNCIPIYSFSAVSCTFAVYICQNIWKKRKRKKRKPWKKRKLRNILLLWNTLSSCSNNYFHFEQAISAHSSKCFKNHILSSYPFCEKLWNC